jgi:hypothetical protein
MITYEIETNADGSYTVVKYKPTAVSNVVEVECLSTYTYYEDIVRLVNYYRTLEMEKSNAS